MYKKKLVRAPTSNEHWIIFMLLPFFSTLYAIWNYKSAWAKNISWAFIIFYGSTFSLSRDTTVEGNESDIVRYANEVKELYKEPMTLKRAVDYFYETGEVDFLKTIIAVIVSRVTDSLNVLTAIYAAIFGFFLTRNLWYLFSKIRDRMRPMLAILIFCFFLVDPFWFINGFRYNTATQIYLYGALPFLFEKKLNGIFIACSSVLVHFSFIIPIIILVIYIVAKNRMTIYFIFFIASSFISQININQLNSIVEDNLSEAIIERSSSYRDVDIVRDFREKDTTAVTASGAAKNWYAIWYLKALFWVLTVILITMYLRYRKHILAQKDLLAIFCFTLLFWGAANILSSIPSVGRFLSVAALFALAFIILFLIRYPKEKYLNDMLYLLFPGLLLFMVVSVRIGFYSLSINTLVGNPILVLFTDYNIAINDIIK